MYLYFCIFLCFCVFVEGGLRWAICNWWHCFDDKLASFLTSPLSSPGFDHTFFLFQTLIVVTWYWIESTRANKFKCKASMNLDIHFLLSLSEPWCNGWILNVLIQSQYYRLDFECTHTGPFNCFFRPVTNFVELGQWPMHDQWSMTNGHAQTCLSSTLW